MLKNRGEELRPKYHLTAPFGLINDPNGFIKYESEYYVFFQWNPSSLVHENKHWGLKKTKDFINFTDAKIILKPDSWYDKDGCYSGTSRIIDDQLYLVYTGNVKDGNLRKSYQCLAKIEGESIVKMGPILKEIPFGYTDHFRDPFYFSRNNKDYFLIGAQSKNMEGKALVYKWDDLHHPQLKGELELDHDLPAYMWECPNLWQSESDVLIFSPQGIPRQKYQYQNLYHSVAVVGKLDLDALKFQSETLQELDYGFDFYAPQILEEEGLLIGWMGLPEHEDLHLSKEENWMHSLTMVRELSFNKDKRLIQKPHPFYKNLRKKKNTYKEKQKGYFNTGEIQLMFKTHQASSFELRLFASENTWTTLSLQNHTLKLDRSQSDGLKGVRYLKLEPREELKLQIFMDKSTLEIFVNDGEQVMSSRIYNKDTNVYFQLRELNNVKIKKYDFYEFEV